MEVLEIIDTAVKIGLGAIISGAATYFTSKQKSESEIEKEKRKWLREERHKAYIKLSGLIMTYGVHAKNSYEMFAVMSEAVLLSKDEDLINDLDKFLHRLAELNRMADEEIETDVSTETSEKIYEELYDQRLELVKRFREDLRKP